MAAKSTFILKDNSAQFMKVLNRAEAMGTAKTVKRIEATAKKNSPVRTVGTPAELRRYGSGTNQRSIVSESKGKSGSIRSSSGYGWWLEILKRTYNIGRRAYLRLGYETHKKQLPGDIRDAWQKISAP